MRDSFDIIDSESSEYAPLILKNIAISAVSLVTMAQISISAIPENAEYVDKLPSYRDIKRKFITSETGRTAAASAAIATSFPYLMHDPDMQGDDTPVKVAQIISDLVDNPSPNVKRIKPSIAEWKQYAKGEMGSAIGQMLSCPSTNLKALNIDGQNVKNFNMEDAISASGISKETFERYSITPEIIAQKIKSIYLVNNSGIPIISLEYDEPKTIYSKIQEEILKESLIRVGVINTNLKKGREPDSAISRSQIEKYLNKYELIAYNFAIRSGDKNILKKYRDIVKQRASE